MSRGRKARPQLEPLESMCLLSGVAAAVHGPHHHPAAATSTGSPGSTLTLRGSESGVFVMQQNSSARNYDITAAGRLTPLGYSATTGNLHVLLGISSGPPNGTLHLAASRGTLTLQIPKSVMIPAGLPTPTSSNEIVDTYTITKGTGSYKGDTGSGVVEFTFSNISSAASFAVGHVGITFAVLPPTATTTSTS